MLSPPAALTTQTYHIMQLVIPVDIKNKPIKTESGSTPQHARLLALDVRSYAKLNRRDMGSVEINTF